MFSVPTMRMGQFPQVEYIMNNTLINPVVVYPNVNHDAELQQKTVKYFMNKLNYWLFYSKSFSKLFQFLSVNNNMVVLKYQNEKAEVHKLEKYNYMLTKIITKKEIHRLLKRYVRNNDINWWDLQTKHIEKKVKGYIHHKLLNFLKNNQVK